MNIVIVAPFCSLVGEPYFNRFRFLAEMMSENHRVSLVTSSFFHAQKCQRACPRPGEQQYEIVLIDEPGYATNISLGRIWSHARFVSNFKRWANGFFARQDVDLVYSAYPLLATNIFLGRLKCQYDFKLVIDVQDVWPEAISSAIPLVKRLPRSIIPFSRKADRAYRAADQLIAVSETYLARASSANPRAAASVLYIGADVSLIERIAAKPLPRDEVHFAYIGSVGHSYDIRTLIEAFNQFRQENLNFRLHIMGDGVGVEELRKRASPSITFYGFLPYETMIAMAKSVDFFINPIKNSAMQSVTNKLSDYFVLGKPVISSQACNEVKGLLELIPSENYQAGSVDSLRAAIKRLRGRDLNCDGRLARMFDRRRSYAEMITGLTRSCNV